MAVVAAAGTRRLMILTSVFLLIGFLPGAEAASSTCNKRGMCLASGSYNHSDYFTKLGAVKAESVTCEDGCATFSCRIKDNKIMVGSGCYKNFRDACADALSSNATSTSTRKNTWHMDEQAYFITCDDGENCAETQLTGFTSANLPLFMNTFNSKGNKNAKDKCEYSGLFNHHGLTQIICSILLVLILTNL